MVETFSPVWSVVGSLLLAVGILLVWVKRAQKNELYDKPIVRLMLSGFVVHVLVLLLLSWINNRVFGHGQLWLSDDIRYDREGQELVRLWTSGHFPHPSDVVGSIEFGYQTLVGILYLVFGANPFVAKMASALLATLTAGYAYRIGERVSDKKVGLVAAALTLFLPDLLFFSSAALKDVPCMFLATQIIWYMMDQHKHDSGWVPPKWGRMTLSLLCLASIRSYVPLALGAAYVTYLTVTARNWRLAGRTTLAWAVVAIFFATTGIFKLGHAQGIPVYARDAMQEPAGVLSFTSLMKGKLEGVNAPQVIPTVTAIGKSVVLSVLAPFAWVLPGTPKFNSEWDYRSDIFTTTSWLWYAMIPATAAGALSFWRKSRFRLIIFGSLFVYWGLATILFQYLPMRHRVQVWPLVLVLTAIGLLHERGVWVKWVPPYVAVLGFIVFAHSGAYVYAAVMATAAVVLTVRVWVLRARVNTPAPNRQEEVNNL